MRKLKLLSSSRAAAIIGAPYVLRKNAEWCVNPWRHRKHHDAVVGKEHIVFCEFMRFNNRDDHPGGWVNVYTTDGRTLQTELYKHQKFLTMLTEMKTHGVDIKMCNFEESQVEFASNKFQS